MTSLSARRVLSDLNANLPHGRPGAQGLKTSKTNSPTKPAPMAESSPQASLSQASLPQARKYGSVDERAPLLGAKRKVYSGDNDSYGEDNDFYGEAKRLKENTGAEHDDGPNLPPQLLGGDAPEVRELLQTSSQEGLVGHHVDPATAPTSPASSFTSREKSALDDSQITTVTTITIPDDDPLPPRPSPLTREEVCQKAREIKLRLSLASYKVRTNQINIPISRLEIRSSTTSSRKYSLPRCTTQTSQSQILSPQKPSPRIPNIHLQQPCTEKKRPQAVTMQLSPSLYRSTPNNGGRLASPIKVAGDATREDFATPLLPCGRQSVLNPPTLDDSPGCEDQGTASMSSSGEGKAADRLLSLMRQEN